MKRLRPFALLTFSIVVAALFTMSYSSWSHSSAYASSSTDLPPVYEHNHPEFFGDGHHKEGDTIEFSSPLYDATNQTVIGSADGGCVYTSDSDTTYQCTWTLTLPDGDIVLSGAQNAQKTKTAYAIVGGTGAYYEIKGEALLTSMGSIASGEASQYKYTFHLAQPLGGSTFHP